MGEAVRRVPALDRGTAHVLGCGATWLEPFVALAPDRMLWGSDWPHVVAKDGVPDDAELIDLLIDWAPDDTTRTKILVHNPAKLYGY